MSPPLFNKLEQPFYCYKVCTSDGWILDVYRLLSRSSTGEFTRSQRQPVLLWHGLSTNHEIFISSDRFDSLGTYLHDLGCDVWLANSRGNKHTKHTSLDPSTREYWDFSLTEYALDVHSVVSFILDKIESPTLAYIGFSQGSTIGLAALSLYEDLNCKIHQFIGLAPNIKPKKWDNKSLHSFIDWMSPEGLTLVFGKRGFLPIASIVSDYFPQRLTKSIIYNVINSSLGWKLNQYGEDQRQLSLYKHIFGLTSVKSFIHWFQIMKDERFQHFDDRDWIWPFLTGSEKKGLPPILFPVKHITTQLSLYCGEMDNICDKDYLKRHLPPHLTKLISIPSYEHLDLIWHSKAHEPGQLWEMVFKDVCRIEKGSDLACNRTIYDNVKGKETDQFRFRVNGSETLDIPAARDHDKVVGHGKEFGHEFEDETVADFQLKTYLGRTVGVGMERRAAKNLRNSNNSNNSNINITNTSINTDNIASNTRSNNNNYITTSNNTNNTSSNKNTSKVEGKIDRNSISNPMKTQHHTNILVTDEQRLKGLISGNSKQSTFITSNIMPAAGMEIRSRTISSTTANSSSSSSSFFHSSNVLKSSPKIPSTLKSVIEAYTNLLSTKNKTSQEQRTSLTQLRLLILKHGVPSLQTRHGTLRSTLWKLLLSVYKVDSVEYAGLIGRGPCHVWEKIENDVFRTLATDVDFTNMVSQDMISRVLHAFCWKSLEQPKSRLVNLSFSYVQGMNVLAAPFLYVMPELEAFACFTSFLTYSCPLYIQPALEGVHCGVRLLDILLLHYDPNLHAHLNNHGASCQVFSFPWILTFSACTPPLHEILQLWDYYIAYGFHLHIFILLSLLISMRDELQNTSSPMKILQKGPKIDARFLIQETLDLIPTCPEELFEMIVRHTYDPSVYEQVMEL